MSREDFLKLMTRNQENKKLREGIQLSNTVENRKAKKGRRKQNVIHKDIPLTCTYPECNSKHVARGFCRKHYQSQIYRQHKQKLGYLLEAR